MAAVSRQTHSFSSRQTHSFSRGSAVLEYWLVHAEGLVVQPHGGRVEHVVVGLPTGRAEALIVRSPITGRRKTIPAGAIAAVEPSDGRLLLDARSETRTRVFSPERIAGARSRLDNGRRLAQVGAVGALRWTRASTAAALSWLRPRIAAGGVAFAAYTRLAAAYAVEGARWLAPRIRRATVMAVERARAAVEARHTR
jgi:hypothetical protein